jgi:hypothetical protein
MSKLDKLSIFATGQNYLYFLNQVKTLRNPTSKRAANEQAQRIREELLQILHQVDREVYVALKALATEVAEYGETDRYRELEAEANRLDRAEADLHAYLDGRKPNGVSPEEKARNELVALATRARVLAASRRFVERKARKSYDGEVVQALVERGVANEPRHAIHVLNLSSGLREGWSNEELLYWGLCYRKARNDGGNKAAAIRVADRALTVG